MADLDFKRKVPEIPAGQALPETKRSVTAEVSPVPDYQSAFSKYAADTNWMSAVGSSIATKASTALATKLGGEAGQTPKGDLGPPITDFDKVYSDSYKTQAYATLGIQASELITNSNLEMAKAPRITPELIASTNQQVSQGLNNIFKNAPNEIHPKLEYTYKHQQLAQSAQLTERMIREQKQDRKSNSAYASKVNAESAHYLASQGNFDAALRSVQATKDIYDDDEAAGISNKLDTKINVDSNRQSALSGKIEYEYEKAVKEGKGEEYVAKLDNPENFPDMNYEDYKIVTSRLLSYISNKEKLRNQDATLAISKFATKLTENPSGITPDDILETKSHLNLVQQQKLDLYYAKAVNAQEKKNAGVTKALSIYTDVNKFPLESAENKNAAWEQTTQNILNTPENVASNMTEDDAKLKAAVIAPVTIPAYITQLTAKAESVDPASLEIAGQQINYFRSHNMGEKLGNLSEKADAVVDVFAKLRGTIPLLDAAKQAHETVYNKSKDQKDANKAALEAFYDSKRKIGETRFQTMKRLLDAPSNLKIRNLPGYVQKATGIFESFFDVTNGDEIISMEKTNSIMASQYGESNINHEPELMYHPIENIPGIPHDAIGQIQSDIVDQANIKFKEDKKFYDDKKSDFWYEARQRISSDEALTSQRIVDEIHQGYQNSPVSKFIFDLENKRNDLNNHSAILDEYKKGQPITIVKHNRSGKDEVFEGVIQANPWGVSTGIPTQPVAGGWDLMLKTPNGAKSITLTNPLSSSIQYNPRLDYINNLYEKMRGIDIFDSLKYQHVMTQHFYQPVSKMLEL